MKKILLVVSALALTAACSAPSTNREATPPVNTNTPAVVAMTEANAITTEKAIWDAVKNRDFEAFGKLLADDQLEVTGEGVFDKAGSIAALKDFEPSELTFSDWRFLSIDKEAFVVSYTVQVKGKYKGKEFPTESARASSAWVQRNGKWLAIYHQECEVRKEPTPTKAAATAKADASPAPAPAATPGPDPVANEKLVWDLFKTKNYDAFGTLLAPEFMEVQNTGVYDKAESLKGVTTFDASKTELSEWKTARLNANAMLVTYVDQTPGMPGAGSRNATIWVNRDGKWLGLFHHGSTPVVKAAPVPSPKDTPAQPVTTPAK
jgi:hypothetical protein